MKNMIIFRTNLNQFCAVKGKKIEIGTSRSETSQNCCQAIEKPPFTVFS